jgi:hypothetical protein
MALRLLLLKRPMPTIPVLFPVGDAVWSTRRLHPGLNKGDSTTM